MRSVAILRSALARDRRRRCTRSPRGLSSGIDVLALDEALARLTALYPEQGRLVELRFFGGLTIEETGEVLGLSPATVKRQWAVARAWLLANLHPEVKS